MHKLVSRKSKKQKTIIDLGDGVIIGGDCIVVIAGPCSVESREQVLQVAEKLKENGIKIMRGGAYKPRTSPYDFQGLGKKGLEHLSYAAQRTGLKIITEIIDPRDVELVSGCADIVQVGARNMQNFALLKEMGSVKKPVMLKRGISSTYKEFLLAAEYVMAAGNRQVILCERGIRAFADELRFTLDLAAVPYLKKICHLPLMVDPSHGTGDASLVIDMCKAAIACGADGLIIETDIDPRKSKCDSRQTISIGALARSLKSLDKVARAIGRTIN